MAEIVSTRDARNTLIEHNRGHNARRTWSQMYAGVDLAAQQAESQIKQSFVDEVSDAYLSSLEQKSSVYGSNIGTGYKEAFNEELSASLQEAYQSYLQNYNKNMSTSQQSSATANQQISDMLNTEAGYYSENVNAYVDYLKWLDEEGYTRSKEYSSYLSRYYNGEVLKSDEELFNMFFTYDDYGGNATLNTEGKRFFQMLDSLQFVTDDQNNEVNMSMNTYLRGHNPELLEWRASQNMYGDVSINNLQSFRQSIGLTDDVVKDFTYGNYQELQFANDKELETLVNDNINFVNTVHQKVTGTGLSTYNIAYLDDMQKYIDDFIVNYGLENSNIEEVEELKFIYDELKDLFNTYQFSGSKQIRNARKANKYYEYMDSTDNGKNANKTELKYMTDKYKDNVQYDSSYNRFVKQLDEYEKVASRLFLQIENYVNENVRLDTSKQK